MAWSTKQLADLAGVTLRSIRHWHDMGLLAEPERLTNGYKQYTAQHLVVALRIARLSDFGFSLDDVARMLESEETGQESLQTLRDELDTRLAELSRIRAEVDELIALGIAPDLSADALRTATALGGDPASRNVAIVLAHVLPSDDIQALVDALDHAPEELDHVNAAIQALPADASEQEIEALVERAVDILGAMLDAHEHAFPDLPVTANDAANSDAFTSLVTDSMNPAQRRTMNLLSDRLGADTRR